MFEVETGGQAYPGVLLPGSRRESRRYYVYPEHHQWLDRIGAGVGSAGLTKVLTWAIAAYAKANGLLVSVEECKARGHTPFRDGTPCPGCIEETWGRLG